MAELAVRHITGDRFEISLGKHVVAVDQPVSGGGRDTAPTPTELFIGGLASCVAFSARRYLARHGMCDEGLEVLADYTLVQRPARVSEVRIEIVLPQEVPDERREALLAVASHCTVHNSLTAPPSVELTLRRNDNLRENESVTARARS